MPLSSVVLLTRATLPADVAMAMVPVASGMGRPGAEPLPAAS